MELNMKKNTKPAKKDTAKKATPLPTNWETTLTTENAWIVRELAKRENVTDEEAYGRILNAGLRACREVVELPAWVDPKWAAAMADPERKERIKRRDEQWRSRPSLEEVGMAFEDDGKELLVRVTGQAYKTLRKAAQAVNRTLGCRAEPADVFKYSVMLESVLTLPQTEMFDALVNGWFWDTKDPNHSTDIEKLEKHLRAVGLFENWWGAPSKKG